jgi:NIF3 (NGG1p interacting factor 3)
MNASDIVQKIKSGFGSAWTDSKTDGLRTGDADAAVRGIAVAWTPTIEVLQRAVAERKNLILTREGPFWEDVAHRSETSVSGPSPTAAIEKTLLYRYKRDYLEKNGLVVWRLSQNWNEAEKSFALRGLESALGWDHYVHSPKDDTLRKMGAGSYRLPPGSLRMLMETVRSRLSAPAARALGDPKAIIRNVVLQPGFLSKEEIMSTVNHAKADAVVCAEGCEWEAFEYAEDWITAGWGKAMVMTGLAVSQDAAAKRIAAWLQSLDLGVPVSFFATRSPFTPVLGDHV